MRFRASGIPRVMLCAGSYLLNARYPDTSGTEAEEGNVAHAYSSDHMINGTPLENIPDAEMLRAVSRYVGVCRSFIVDDGVVAVEERHDITLSGLTLGGTPDFFTWGPDNVLTIIDLKYGHGWVEAELNWQLITYAVLMWLKYGNGATPVTVRLVIVQPRANHPGGPVREWTFDGVLLRNYMNMIDNQISIAQYEGAETVAGQHYRYCDSIVECHTNRGAIAELIDYAGTAAVVDMDGPSLAHELNSVKNAMDMINHRYIALEAHASERIKTGNIVPGYQVKQVYGSLAWDTDPLEIMGAALAQDTKPITPTQAIDRNILTENQVKLMASRKLGKFTLKKENLNFAKEIIKNATG